MGPAGWRVGTALVTIAGLVAAGCVGTAGEAGTPSTSPPLLTSDEATRDDGRVGTVRWAIREPDEIVPPLTVDRDGLVVVDALFDSLTGYGPDLEPVPAAAASWAATDGASEWTFHLRTGATFHDGAAVTAADFRFAWELAIRRDQAGYLLRDVVGYEALARGDAPGLAGVTAVDAHTLVVRLSRPIGEFPALVAHPSLGPVAAHRWEAGEQDYREQPVGNGPFALQEAWARGQFLRVNRTPHWRNGGPTNAPEGTLVGEILFRITDPDTGYVAFQQGRLDITTVPHGALEEAEAVFARSVGGYAGPGVLHGDLPVLYYLGVDPRRPPFDDRGVRKAISLAVDRSAFVQEVPDGDAAPARSAIPSALAGYQPGTCTACRYAPEVARSIFADRGVTRLDFWFNAEGGHELVARQLRDDLAKVGVDVGFQRRSFGSFLDALEAGEAGLFRMGWSADTPSAARFLTALFHSRSGPDGWGWGANFGGYEDRQVDALLDHARAARVESVRLAYLRAAEERALNRDQAIIPLMTYRQRTVVSERLRGFELNPLGFANLHEVTLAN